MRIGFIERNDVARTIDFDIDGNHIGHIRYAILKHSSGRDIPCWETKIEVGDWHYHAHHAIETKLSRVVEDMILHTTKAGDRFEREAEKLRC